VASAAAAVKSEYKQSVKREHNSSHSLSGSEGSIEVSDLAHDDLFKNIENGLGNIKNELQTSIRSQGSNPEVYEDLRSSLLSLQDQVHVLKSSLTKKAQADDGIKSSVTRRARFSDQVDARPDHISIEKLEDLTPSPPKSQNELTDPPRDLRESLVSNQSSSEKYLDEFGDSLRSLRDDMKVRHQYNMSSNKRATGRGSIGSATDDVSMTSSSSKRSSRSSLRGPKGYRRSSLELDIRDDASLTSELDQSYYSYSDEDDRTTRTMQTIKSMRVPEKEATIIYTDVQGSTSLWEAHPLSMKKATDVHDSIIRKCYSEHGGYEISTEGDSFNLAFQHPADAIGFALKAQLALYKANWPEEILSHEDGNFNEKRAFRGFRVRMGMHHGPVESNVHETTGRTIYQGEAVDIAKSIEKMSHGGQILTTVETWRAVSGMAEQHLGKPQVMDCGEHLLYDPTKKPKTKATSKSPIYQSKRILQLVPNQLAYDFFEARQEVKEGETRQRICGRVFPPLLSHGQLSTSFLNAPFSKNRVAMVFVYTDKMELAFDNERKRNQKYLAKYIRKNLMQLSPPREAGCLHLIEQKMASNSL
jgi:class 3 adenylate cyclase